MPVRSRFDRANRIDCVTQRDLPTFPSEIKAVPASWEGADQFLCRFKLRNRFQCALSALRAVEGDFHRLHRPLMQTAWTSLVPNGALNRSHRLILFLSD